MAANPGVFQSLSQLSERCSQDGICSLCLKEMHTESEEDIEKHVTKHWNTKIAIEGLVSVATHVVIMYCIYYRLL